MWGILQFIFYNAVVGRYSSMNEFHAARAGLDAWAQQPEVQEFFPLYDARGVEPLKHFLPPHTHGLFINHMAPQFVEWLQNPDRMPTNCAQWVSLIFEPVMQEFDVKLRSLAYIHASDVGVHAAFQATEENATMFASDIQPSFFLYAKGMGIATQLQEFVSWLASNARELSTNGDGEKYEVRCIGHSAKIELMKSMKSFYKQTTLYQESLWNMVDFNLVDPSPFALPNIRKIQVAFESLHEATTHLTRTLPALMLEDPLRDRQGFLDNGGFLGTYIMRKETFRDGRTLDKGVCKTMLRFMGADATLADFGALNGQYSTWFNETGMVEAYAFDAAEDVEDLTDHRVEQRLWKRFDYVMSIEVAEHIAPENMEVYLKNLARHAVKGIFISWADDEGYGIGHFNAKSEEEWIPLVEKLGFKKDRIVTNMLREASTLSWVSKSIAYFQRTSGQSLDMLPDETLSF